MGLEVRTRKPVLKVSSRRKRKRPPPSSRPPGQKAVTNHPSPHLAGAPHPGQEGGWKEGAAGLPFLYPIAGASMKKSRGAQLHPREARAMAESFSVLGCGSTCPPLSPSPTWCR